MTMRYPLLVSNILNRARTAFPDKEIITRTEKGSHRYTYRDMAARVNRLCNALSGLGVRKGDRVGTFGWNTYRHLEAYFASPVMGAVNHTINIRLFPDDLVYIVNHAQDKVIFVDPDLCPILESLAPQLESVEHFIIMTDDPEPATGLPNALCYETLLAQASDDFTPPELDELDPAGLCYTSATTGPSQGRYLYPPRPLSSFHGRVHGRHGRLQRGRYHHGHGAHVPCQLLGVSLLQRPGGGQPGNARGAPRPPGHLRVD